MKLNILAFAAHPDDVELAAGGTIIKHIKKGYKVGIADITKGELGTRGNAETRFNETLEANKILGLSIRENLELPDGFFNKNHDSLIKVITCIRKYQPDIVLCNAIYDRHTDHGKAADLVAEAAFLSGLIKIETFENKNLQEAWRPKNVYHYIQDRYIKPDFVVDISDYFEDKMNAIKAYKSQFYNPDSIEPQTPISGKDFMEFLNARAKEFGRAIGVKYGEGFTVKKPVGISNLFDIF
ncbi:MAG: bacillithiol biosynthesis deacetylase BshB1 [Bacteroidia bacterium]